LLLLPGCNRSHEITYRIILSDQYVGWVKVDFEVKTGPALRLSPHPGAPGGWPLEPGCIALKLRVNAHPRFFGLPIEEQLRPK
jgi:hypothetical protein